MLSSAFGPLSARPGSAGLPMPGMDVRIVDDSGRELPQGQMGNLVLAPPLAPSFLGGLWRNPDRFFSSYFSTFAQKGGWFETGDQGIIDQDGYVSILARSDDIINVSAHRLGTGLIEQVVTSHPDVIECAVVGAPDKLKGQSPFAIVVAHSRVATAKDAGKALNSVESEEVKGMLKSINDHVRKEMGPIAQLSGLIEAQKLPKTRSGKTLRRSLRQAVENAASGKRGKYPLQPTGLDFGLCSVLINFTPSLCGTMIGLRGTNRRTCRVSISQLSQRQRARKDPGSADSRAAGSRIYFLFSAKSARTAPRRTSSTNITLLLRSFPPLLSHRLLASHQQSKKKKS